MGREGWFNNGSSPDMSADHDGLIYTPYAYHRTSTPPSCSISGGARDEQP